MDEFIAALATALEQEFTFVGGEREDWLKAARGIAEKMGVTTDAPNYGDFDWDGPYMIGKVAT